MCSTTRDLLADCIDLQLAVEPEERARHAETIDEMPTAAAGAMLAHLPALVRAVQAATGELLQQLPVIETGQGKRLLVTRRILVGEIDAEPGLVEGTNRVRDKLQQSP